MRQLDPYPTARVRLGYRQLERIVGGTVVEGALVCITRQLEDGVRAVLVARRRGKPAFRNAIEYVVELRGVGDICGCCYWVY